MVGFSKYEFYNKLLGGVTLFRVTLGVTWTQPIYIYIGQNDKIPIYLGIRLCIETQFSKNRVPNIKLDFWTIEL